MPKNTSITLGEHFDEFISHQVDVGRYASVSEVVRASFSWSAAITCVRPAWA